MRYSLQELREIVEALSIAEDQLMVEANEALEGGDAHDTRVFQARLHVCSSALEKVRASYHRQIDRIDKRTRAGGA